MTDITEKLAQALKNVLSPKYGKEWDEAQKVLKEYYDLQKTPGDKIHETFKDLECKFAGKDFLVDTNIPSCYDKSHRKREYDDTGWQPK